MPRLGVMIEEPRPVSNPGLARRRFALDSSTLLAIGESTAESWRRAGASDVRSADPEPGLAPASDHDRVSARRSMHIEDDRIAVAMLADRPECCSARRFAFILGLLYTTGCSVTGIFPAGAGQARRAARFARAHGRRWSEVMWEGDTRTMIDACDIAICDVADRSTTEFDTDWLTPTAGAQTLAIACARGVPVIVPRHPLTEELGRAGWPLTIALGGNQIDLAAALLPLASGTGLRTGGAVPRSAVRLPAAGPMRLSAVLAGLYTELAARAPGAAFPARSYIVGAA
jgi:hypothetical protein